MNNIPREKLRYIIREHGIVICKEPKRCEAFLRDYCGAYKREINVLIGALKERVAADFMNSANAIPELLFENLVKRLCNNLAMTEEAARWAVESWALALGLISEECSESSEESDFLEKPGSDSEITKYQLRHQPRILSDGDVRVMIEKYDFFCKKESWTEKWHNESGNFGNDFEDNGNGTITDHATELTWQQAGSNSYLYLRDSESYIKELNGRCFGSCNDWRIPTVEELLSLLEPKKQSKDLHINFIFDNKQRCCWSSDKHASGGAWSVHFDLGIVYWSGIRNYVRAVRP